MQFIYMNILPPLLPTNSYSLNLTLSSSDSASSSDYSSEYYYLQNKLKVINIPESSEHAHVAQSTQRNEKLERVHTTVSTSLFIFSAVLSFIAFTCIFSLRIFCRKIKRASECLRRIQRETEMVYERLENNSSEDIDNENIKVE